MSEHDKENSHQPSVNILNHSKIGDVFIHLSPALNGSVFFALALAALFIGVFWWTNPHSFVTLVGSSVLTVAGFLNIVLWLAIATGGGLILNKLFMPFLHSLVSLFRPAPMVHAVNDNFTVYSGKLQVHDHLQDGRVKVSELAPPPAALALPPPTEDVEGFKTFAELLAEGTIARALKQGQLVMGYMYNATTKAWALRYGSWLDLYSCAVAGVSGSGKTTTVLFILLQAIMAGGKLVIIDPHLANTEESLAARLEVFNSAMIAPPCDHTPKEVLRRVRWLKQELDRRVKLGLKPPALQRVVFVVDEFNSIMQKGGSVAEELQSLLVEIEQEGRKFGMFAMLIGQNWSANSIGDALIRQCLASAMVHRMSEIAQAKKLLPLTKHANSTIELDQGYWIFKDTRGKFEQMYTPYTDENDGPEVVQSLPVEVFTGRETSSPITVKPVQNQFIEVSLVDTVKPVQNQFETSSRNQFNAALQAKLAQVIKLQAEGVQKPDIMRQVWDVTPSKSDKYVQANEEYLAIMREIQKRLSTIQVEVIH